MVTYIFGAGASKHAGYPLASSLGKELQEWLSRRANPSPGDLNLQEFLSTLPVDINFEDELEKFQLLIGLDETTLSPEQRRERATVAQHMSHLKTVLRAWFSELGGSNANAYRDFSKRIVKAGDAIITFNYDVAIELVLRKQNLWELSDGYGFQIQGFLHRSPIEILKLHGSVSWLAIPFGGQRGFFQFNPGSTLGSRPVITPYDCKAFGYTDRTDPEWPENRAAAISPLILPARSKQFFFQTSSGIEWTEFWDKLWEKASEKLKASDHIFICGYSLPTADERARELLFTSINKDTKVEVSCGNDSSRIVDELKSRGISKAHISRKTLFEEWVASQ